MKIIILTVEDHIYSNYLIKNLVKDTSLEIVGIVESTVLYPNKSKWGGLMRYFKKSGVKYVSYQMVKNIFYKLATRVDSLFQILPESSLYYSYKRNIKENSIPIIKVANINTSDAIRRLRILNPDLVISLLFNQILKSEVLDVPSTGTINLHPSLLPKYKGVSPTFWVLANDEKQTGVSIHTIEDEQIDAGNLLRQVKVDIESFYSEHMLYMKCMQRVYPILRQLLVELSKDKGLFERSSMTEVESDCGDKYYSLPSSHAVDRFLSKNKKFFYWKEILSLK